MASTSLVNGLLLLAFCGAALAATPVTQEIPVTVYFESYCPDSVKFLTKQLYPVYLTSLKDHMKIMLVPYGKATMNKTETGEYKFECHHGEKECYGNKVIACVLKDRDTTFMEQFKFINCTSSHIAANPKIAEYPVKECASTTAYGESIMNCAGNITGSEFLAEYGNKTNELTPALKSVPTVVFNEKYVDSENSKATSDFRNTLCGMITGTKPAECAKGGAVTLQTAMFTIITALVVVSHV